MTGNLTGSAHQRCPFCDIDFSQHDNLWKLRSLRAATPKTLLELSKAWAAGIATSLGMKHRSPLIPLWEHIQRDPILQEWVKKFVLGVDPLHVIKGHWATLLDRLFVTPTIFDADEFARLLEEHVQRRCVSDLDGAHMRELVLRWKQVLLPALRVQGNTLDQFKVLFHQWAEVLHSY